MEMVILGESHLQFLMIQINEWMRRTLVLYAVVMFLAFPLQAGDFLFQFPGISRYFHFPGLLIHHRGLMVDWLGN